MKRIKKLTISIMLIITVISTVMVFASCGKEEKPTQVVLNGFEVRAETTVNKGESVTIERPLVTDEEGNVLDVYADVENKNGGYVPAQMGSFIATDVGGYLITYRVYTEKSGIIKKQTVVHVNGLSFDLSADYEPLVSAGDYVEIKPVYNQADARLSYSVKFGDEAVEVKDGKFCCDNIGAYTVTINAEYTEGNGNVEKGFYTYEVYAQRPIQFGEIELYNYDWKEINKYSGLSRVGWDVVDSNELGDIQYSKDDTYYRTIDTAIDYLYIYANPRENANYYKELAKQGYNYMTIRIYMECEKAHMCAISTDVNRGMYNRDTEYPYAPMINPLLPNTWNEVRINLDRNLDDFNRSFIDAIEGYQTEAMPILIIDNSDDWNHYKVSAETYAKIEKYFADNGTVPPESWYKTNSDCKSLMYYVANYFKEYNDIPRWGHESSMKIYIGGIYATKDLKDDFIETYVAEDGDKLDFSDVDVKGFQTFDVMFDRQVVKTFGANDEKTLDVADVEIDGKKVDGIYNVVFRGKTNSGVIGELKELTIDVVHKNDNTLWQDVEADKVKVSSYVKEVNAVNVVTVATPDDRDEPYYKLSVEEPSVVPEPGIKIQPKHKKENIIKYYSNGSIIFEYYVTAVNGKGVNMDSVSVNLMRYGNTDQIFKAKVSCGEWHTFSMPIADFIEYYDYFANYTSLVHAGKFFGLSEDGYVKEAYIGKIMILKDNVTDYIAEGGNYTFDNACVFRVGQDSLDDLYDYQQAQSVASFDEFGWYSVEYNDAGVRLGSEPIEDLSLSGLTDTVHGVECRAKISDSAIEFTLFSTYLDIYSAVSSYNLIDSANITVIDNYKNASNLISVVEDVKGKTGKFYKITEGVEATSIKLKQNRDASYFTTAGLNNGYLIFDYYLESSILTSVKVGYARTANGYYSSETVETGKWISVQIPMSHILANYSVFEAYTTNSHEGKMLIVENYSNATTTNDVTIYMSQAIVANIENDDEIKIFTLGEDKLTDLFSEDKLSAYSSHSWQLNGEEVNDVNLDGFNDGVYSVALYGTVSNGFTVPLYFAKIDIVSKWQGVDENYAKSYHWGSKTTGVMSIVTETIGGRQGKYYKLVSTGNETANCYEVGIKVSTMHDKDVLLDNFNDKYFEFDFYYELSGTVEDKYKKYYPFINFVVYESDGKAVSYQKETSVQQGVWNTFRVPASLILAHYDEFTDLDAVSNYGKWICVQLMDGMSCELYVSDIRIVDGE